MRIKVNGLSINSELAGRGKSVTLLHGMGDDLTLWSGVAQALSASYQVLTVDLRGFGLSDKPETGYSLDEYVKDVFLLLQKLEIARTVVCGFSMGGVIAQKFTLDHPEQVKGLIVVSTASECNTEASLRFERVAYLAEKDGLEAMVSDEVGKPLMEGRFLPGFLTENPKLYAQYRERWLKNDPKGLAGAARSMAHVSMTAELPKIGCPTLILVGEQDKTVGVGGSVIMSRKIAGSRLKVIKECGHDVPREQPKAFTTHVLEFLQGVYQ